MNGVLTKSRFFSQFFFSKTNWQKTRGCVSRRPRSPLPPSPPLPPSFTPPPPLIVFNLFLVSTFQTEEEKEEEEEAKNRVFLCMEAAQEVDYSQVLSPGTEQEKGRERKLGHSLPPPSWLLRLLMK